MAVKTVTRREARNARELAPKMARASRRRLVDVGRCIDRAGATARQRELLATATDAVDDLIAEVEK